MDKNIKSKEELLKSIAIKQVILDQWYDVDYRDWDSYVNNRVRSIRKELDTQLDVEIEVLLSNHPYDKTNIRYNLTITTENGFVGYDAVSNNLKNIFYAKYSIPLEVNKCIREVIFYNLTEVQLDYIKEFLNLQIYIPSLSTTKEVTFHNSYYHNMPYEEYLTSIGVNNVYDEKLLKLCPKLSVKMSDESIEILNHNKRVEIWTAMDVTDSPDAFEELQDLAKKLKMIYTNPKEYVNQNKFC